MNEEYDVIVLGTGLTVSRSFLDVICLHGSDLQPVVTSAVSACQWCSGLEGWANAK